MNNKHDVAKLLLTHYPDGVKKQDCNDRLPLHLAYMNRSDLELMKRLVRDYANGVRIKDIIHGSLPLHLACSNKASFDVIKYLSEYNKKTLLENDANNRVPLHLACIAHNEHLNDPLWEKEVDAWNIVDIFGHTPEDYLV